MRGANFNANFGLIFDAKGRHEIFLLSRLTLADVDKDRVRLQHVIEVGVHFVSP